MANSVSIWRCSFSDSPTRRPEFLRDDRLERLIDLGPKLDSLCDGIGSTGSNHKFLERHGISGMLTTVQHVEEGRRHDIRSSHSRLFPQKVIQRNILY